MRYIRSAKTKEECDEFLLQVIAYSETEKLFGRWAVEDKFSKEFVGSFAIIPVEGKEQMQLGYALLPEHWGKGYATELPLQAFIMFLRKLQLIRFMPTQKRRIFLRKEFC